jgi:hypothetical protein
MWVSHQGTSTVTHGAVCLPRKDCEGMRSRPVRPGCACTCEECTGSTGLHEESCNSVLSVLLPATRQEAYSFIWYLRGGGYTAYGLWRGVPGKGAQRHGLCCLACAQMCRDSPAFVSLFHLKSKFSQFPEGNTSGIKNANRIKLVRIEPVFEMLPV